MYDPAREDIWQSAIRAAESVEIESYFAGRASRGRTSSREKAFNEAKQMIIAALRKAQKESVARRYLLVKGISSQPTKER